jgi:hypothetical protein
MQRFFALHRRVLGFARGAATVTDTNRSFAFRHNWRDSACKVFAAAARIREKVTAGVRRLQDTVGRNIEFMQDQSQKKYARESATAKGTPAETREVERRNAERQAFTAAAEVVDLGSGARFSTRTTDLGPGGCFVDTIVPFPVDSKVRVSIRRDKLQFEAGGVVVYSQAGLGMGIAFNELRRGQQNILEQWLDDSGRIQQHAVVQSSTPAERPVVSVGSDHAAFVRLVRLMIIKGILTEAEGTTIFTDPVFF